MSQKVISWHWFEPKSYILTLIWAKKLYLDIDLSQKVIFWHWFELKSSILTLIWALNQFFIWDTILECPYCGVHISAGGGDGMRGAIYFWCTILYIYPLWPQPSNLGGPTWVQPPPSPPLQHPETSFAQPRRQQGVLGNGMLVEFSEKLIFAPIRKLMSILTWQRLRNYHLNKKKICNKNIDDLIRKTVFTLSNILWPLKSFHGKNPGCLSQFIL